ncbi:MAG: hypothetical protein M1839_005487 [Geoglossum umbratile]|nr:MAG: hypothetical protein M1839_005487 [Geoglossum umbratile]
MSLISPYDQHGLHAQSRLDALTQLSPAQVPDGPKFRFRAAPTPSEQPVIPPEDLFASLSGTVRPSLTESDDIPNTARCASHLELLEAFAVLKNKVINSNALDRTFGIKHERQNDPALPQRRQVKWTKFVKLAVVRFKLWFATTFSRSPLLGLPEHTGGRLDRTRLPPLDVLMVWHAFMLNPQAYEDECLSLHEDSVSGLESLWKQVHEAINASTRDYSMQNGAADLGSESNSLGDLVHADLLKFLSAFNDMHSVSWNILSEGPVEAPLGVEDIKREMQTEYYNNPDNAVEAYLIRGYSEVGGTHFSDDVTAALGRLSGFNLIDAVNRVSKFVDRMCTFLWIRSPALLSTLQRARNRYRNLFKLSELYPDRLITPTLDIDLVLRTHQLSPSGYRRYSIRTTGRLVVHDDEVGQDILNSSLREVESLYRARFCDSYLLCHCWDCEAIREAIDKASKNGIIDIEAIGKKVRLDVAYYRAVEIARRKKEMLPVRE